MKNIFKFLIALTAVAFTSQAQDTWVQKSDFGYNASNVPEPSARNSAVGFSIGNKGYLGTGEDGGPKKDFWEYDPDANTWTQKADFG
ncbi:MAG: kelch repeat-containing protein, partial [Chitinophagales bacterium]